MRIANLRYLAWLGLSGLVLVGQPGVVDAQSSGVAFYVVAHQDDWQLFMNAFNNDVTTPPKKIVLVYTTAGSACGPEDNNPQGHTMPHYMAREVGAEAAARALADQTDQSPGRMDSVVLTGDNQQHSILRYIFRNTVSYFLRLPESSDNPFCCFGDEENKVFKTPCLLTLQSGNVNFPTLPAVDDSTTYQSWKDLVLTLKALVTSEAGSAQNSALSFNIQDPDKVANDQDNPDHYATGAAILEVTNDFPGANITLYCEYSTFLNPANVLCRSDAPPDDSNCGMLQNKSAVFAATAFAIAELGWLPNTWDPKSNPPHTGWLSRLYQRPPTGDSNYCLARQHRVPLVRGFAP
jgi:hypothetical protein